MDKVPKVIKDAPINFGTTSYKGNGSAILERKVAIFQKREAMLMAMSYSYDIQAQVFDAWTEAEKRLKGELTLPTTYIAALECLVQSEKQKEALLLQSAEDKPKVLFHDAVTASENTKTIEEVGKSLGVGRNTLFKELRSQGILCSNNLPKQRFIDNGCFEVVTYEFKDTLGIQRSNVKTVVTGKGQTYIHKLLCDIQN